MVTASVYVEGGGGSRAVNTACRRGFSKFIEKAGLAGNMPKIVACGSRGDAYQSFRTVQSSGKATAILLVDAEVPFTASGPWEHLKAADGWDRPDGATDGQCHLMVQVMESWFLADVDALKSFYGQRFRTHDLPPNPNKEEVSKQDVLAGLARATRDTKSYKKGSDSFQILEKLDPDKVRKASPYADRFIKALP